MGKKKEVENEGYGKALSEEEWKNPPPKPKHKSKVEGRIDVTLDMSEEDVLKYDNEKKNLFFDGDLGKFKELSDETLSQLSNINRVRYFSSYGEYLYNKRRENEPKISERVKVSPRYATATKRLEVLNKKPGKWYAWKRTDEIRSSIYEGYQRSEDPDLITFGGDAGAGHTVGADGETELVLMETSMENHEERQRAISEKSERRVKAVEETAKEEMKRDGGLPYEATGPDDHPFTPAVRGNNSPKE